MAAEEKRFVLYEYLLFIWKKKLWFIVVIALTMILAAVATKVLIHRPAFTGNATIFTGSIKNKSLTDPESIKGQYKKDIKNSWDAYVSSDSYIKFKVNGADRASVQKDLDTLTDGVMKGLNQAYVTRFGVTNAYISSMQKRIESLEDINKIYRQRIDENTVSESTKQRYNEQIEANEAEKTQQMTTLNRVNGDLTFFEKPALVVSSVSPGKSYLKQSLALGFVLGILLSFVVLVLWKYIFDAKQYYRD